MIEEGGHCVYSPADKLSVDALGVAGGSIEIVCLTRCIGLGKHNLLSTALWTKALYSFRCISGDRDHHRRRGKPGDLCIVVTSVPWRLIYMFSEGSGSPWGRQKQNAEDNYGEMLQAVSKAFRWAGCSRSLEGLCTWGKVPSSSCMSVVGRTLASFISRYLG